MKNPNFFEKEVKALKKVVDPAKVKATVADKQDGGAWAIGIGFSAAFVVPK